MGFDLPWRRAVGSAPYNETKLHEFEFIERASENSTGANFGAMLSPAPNSRLSR